MVKSNQGNSKKPSNSKPKATNAKAKPVAPEPVASSESTSATSSAAPLPTQPHVDKTARRLGLGSFVIAFFSLFVAAWGQWDAHSERVANLKNKEIKFVFNNGTYFSGEASDDNPILSDNESFILLSGSVTNTGTTPLNPAVFSLDVLVDGKWETLERKFLPDTPNLVMIGTSFDGQEEIVEVTQPAARYLNRFIGVLKDGGMVSGHFMFASQKLRASAFRVNSGLRVRISCKTLDGIKYYTKEISIDDMSKHIPSGSAEVVNLGMRIHRGKGQSPIQKKNSPR